MLQIRDPLLREKTCARCCVSQKGKGKMTVFVLGVQDFPFWGRSRIARSLGFRVSAFRYETTYCALLRVALVVARTILSVSRCYGYVLSLPRAISISHIHKKSVTEFCEELREKSHSLIACIFGNNWGIIFIQFRVSLCYTEILLDYPTDIKYNINFMNLINFTNLIFHPSCFIHS